jgi:hypothetical protein
MKQEGSNAFRGLCRLRRRAHYSRIAMPNGTIEDRVVCRLRESVRQWLLSQSNFEEAHAAMVKEAAQEQTRVASHAH